MRPMSVWAGVACGVVLAVAGGFAVEGVTNDADAKSGVSVTSGQLETNQRISQAAVRRSNRALNYLAPIRTPASDAADTGRTGVKPLSAIPGAGGGWTSGQIADGAVTSSKLAPAVRAQVEAPPGPTADGRQVPNMNDIACDTDVTVGDLTVQVARTSRIWVHGHGTMRKNNSSATAFSLRLRLRDAANTQTLATSIPALDSTTFPGDTDNRFQLTTGGVLQAGDDPETSALVFEAPPGTYVLQLVARAGEGATCTPGQLPDFGFNQYGAMSYMLIATG